MTCVPDELKQYCGRSPKISSIHQQIGYQLSLVGSDACYGKETADWALKDRQILYNAQTVDYIYSDFSPLDIRYAKGTRPLLERIVRAICADEMTDQDKVLAILDYVYRGHQKDNVDIFPHKGVYILNALEEEIPKLGRVSCECHSRLIICLCQIAGFPARNISTYNYVDPTRDFKIKGGHTMVEVYLDEKWSLFDSDYGFFCIMDDQRIAGLHDVMTDPSLVPKQPDWVYNRFGKDKQWHLHVQNHYLSPHSVMSLSNYDADEYARYDWKWIFFADDGEQSRRIQAARTTLRAELLEKHSKELQNLSP